MIKINGIARLLPISVGVFNRPQFPEGAAILNCIGSRLPFAAAARMRDASFTYIEDVRLALGRMVATSSSADWWSIEDKFELIAASCELSIFQSRSAPLESRLPRRGIASSYSNVPLVSKRRQPRLLVSGVEITTVDATHSFQSRK